VETYCLCAVWFLLVDFVLHFLQIRSAMGDGDVKTKFCQAIWNAVLCERSWGVIDVGSYDRISVFGKHHRVGRAGPSL